MGDATLEKTFSIALADLQPSQLMISAAKLERVGASLLELEPLPVRRLAGRLVLTDGHTRALAAHREGREEIAVFWDEDDLDWELYEICVGWCLAEGVHCISDLADRIVPHEDHRRLWIDRCRAEAARLEEERAASDRD